MPCSIGTQSGARATAERVPTRVAHDGEGGDTTLAYGVRVAALIHRLQEVCGAGLGHSLQTSTQKALNGQRKPPELANHKQKALEEQCKVPDTVYQTQTVPLMTK